MNKKDIKKILRGFSSIKPNKDFTEKSRFIVLSVAKETPIQNEKLVGQGIFANISFDKLMSIRPINVAYLITAVSTLFIVIYYSIVQLSPVFLPGLNHQKIVAEAKTVNQKISIEINQIKHFNYVSKESNVALNNVAKHSLDHLNKSIIEKENNKINNINDNKKDTNKKIDSILKQF